MLFRLLLTLILVGANLAAFPDVDSCKLSGFQFDNHTSLKSRLLIHVDVLEKSEGEDQLACNYDIPVDSNEWNVSVILVVNASEALGYVPLDTNLYCTFETTNYVISTEYQQQIPIRREITARWIRKAYHFTNATCHNLGGDFDKEELEGPTLKATYEVEESELAPSLLQSLLRFTEFVCEAVPEDS